MKKFLFILIASLVFLLAGCDNAFIYEHVVTKIAIQNEPTKTVYNVGEEADWSGLEVKAIYFDGESELVEPETITGFDSSVAVDSQTITVTYKEKTATFTVKIEEGGTNPTKTLSSIAITTNPTKTTYKVGDIENWTGLKLTATYSDGTTSIVEPETIIGFDSSVAVDSQTITVTYKGKTATFTVKIEEGGTNPTKTLSSIAITANPTKTTYKVGDIENWTGLNVTATYSDGTTSIVEPETITGFDSSVAVDSQTITVTYKGKTATFTVKIEEGGTNPTKTLSSIAITTNPTKTTYKVGDTSEWAGLKVTATYSDGTTSVITPDSITGFDSSVAVDSQTITVTYKGKTATFTVKIEQPVVLSSIAITTNPTKTTYKVGDTSEWAGLKVTATYSDGTTSVVTPDSITGFDSSVAVDSQTITVTYKGKTATFTVKIEQPVVLSSIAITTNPTKTTYKVGDTSEWAGLKVTATYSNGTTSVVTPETITGFDSSVAVDSQTITVTYKGKTATFTVKIEQPVVLSSIAITTNPTKTTYKVGEEADWSGLVVTATYSDNTPAVIPIADCNITGFDSTTFVESQTITVSYGGKTATFNIRIKPTRDQMLKHITDTFCFLAIGSYNPNSNYEKCLFVTQPDNHLVTELTNNEYFFNNTDNFIRTYNNSNYIMIQDFTEKLNDYRTQYNNAVYDFMNNSDKIQCIVAYVSLYTEFIEPIGSLYSEPTTFSFYSTVTDSNTYPMTSSATDEEVEEYYDIVYNLTKDWIKGEQKSEEIKVACRNYVLSLRELFDAKKTYAYELSNYFYTNNSEFFKELLNALDTEHLGKENNLGNRYTLSMDTMYDDYVLVKVYGLDCYGEIYFKDGKAYYCLGKADSICFEIEEGGSNPTKTLSSIAITANPTKTAYKVGDTSDWTGLEVTATYSDTSTAVIPIADCNITGFDSTSVVESQTITVSYGGKSVNFTIEIKPTRDEMLKHITDTFYFFGIGDYNQNSNYEKCLLVSQPNLSIMVTEMTENEKFFYDTEQFILENSSNRDYIDMISDFTDKLSYYRTQYDNVVNDFMGNSDKTKYLVAYKNLDTEFLEAITSLTSEPTIFSFFESITNVNAYPMTSSATDEEVEECYDIVYNLTKNWIKGEQKSEEIKVACRNYIFSLKELFEAKQTNAYELSDYFNTKKPAFFKAFLNYLDSETSGEENKLGNRYTLSMDTMYDDDVLVNVYGLFVYGKVYFKNDKAYYLIRTEAICFE